MCACVASCTAALLLVRSETVMVISKSQTNSSTSDESRDNDNISL